MTVGMLILIFLAVWICGSVFFLGWKLVVHLGKEVPLDGSPPLPVETQNNQSVTRDSSEEGP
jgi:hypothetical protein